MALRAQFPLPFLTLSFSSSPSFSSKLPHSPTFRSIIISTTSAKSHRHLLIPPRFPVISASLDLTEDNIRQVLVDARAEFPHLFDLSVGMTGEVDLAELDGPFVKISLKGRFWHERSMVLARISNYLKSRIPEILEVEIEDEKQLDDSPANF